MIIGLGYRARSGKDTVASYLVGNYGFRCLAFADSLKEAARDIFGLTREQLYGDSKDLVDTFWGVSPRYILQKLGTECLRKGYAQDVWIRSMHKRMSNDPTTHNWVISDVRFPNEAEALLDWGGMLIRIDRPGFEERRRRGILERLFARFRVGANVGIQGHKSETSMARFHKWNHILVNDGSLQQLYTRIDEIMSSHHAKPTVANTATAEETPV